MYASNSCQDNIFKIESQIKKYEQEMNFISNKKFFRKIKSDKFKNVYKNFKYSINALMEDSKYFITIRDICIRENTPNEIEFFNTEHYDYIQKYKKFGKKLLNVIRYAVKSDIITNFEYKLLKDINKRIENVWKTDEIFLYMYADEVYDIPTFKEIEFYFSLLDIIFSRIDCFTFEKKNFIEILDNDDYIDLIKSMKHNLTTILTSISTDSICSQDNDIW